MLYGSALVWAVTWKGSIMKVCIYGAGAIGGYLAVALAEAGVAVSVVARGPHLAAIQTRGLELRMDDRVRRAEVRAV